MVSLMLRSLSNSLPLGLEVRKALRPSVAIDRVRDRLDWVKLARAVAVTPRDDLTRLGSSYGGYVIPAGLPRADWICYSAGLGEDVSFETQLIQRYACRVQAFDPTPRSVEYANQVAATEPRLKVYPLGLWSEDCQQRFYAPRDADHVSHSISNLQQTSTYFVAECRRVTSVMRELGDERLDLLKMDIEGAEHAVLETLAEDGIEPKLLLVDVHATPSIAQSIATVRSLCARGYVVVHLFRSDVTLVHESVA